MKLLNELITVRRIDDDPEAEDNLDQDLDYVEDGDGEEDVKCEVCGMDPCTCDHDSDEFDELGDEEGLDDMSDDMGKLDDLENEDPLSVGDDDVGSYGYDEFDLPADDAISPYHEYSDEEDEHGMKEECPSCNGHGIDYGETCVRCGGKGYIVSGQYDDSDEDEGDDDMCRPRIIDIEDEGENRCPNCKCDPCMCGYEDEEHTMNRMRRHMRKCPMCGMHHGMFDRCQDEDKNEENEDDDMIRGQMGAYGQQGAHMGGEKDTDTQETDYNPDAADELDLDDDLGDNDAETEEGDPKLDALTDKASEDPDRQGVVRTVKGAHLIYKRQTEDGTYEELWIYNTGNMRDELDIRKAILAGTDIPTSKTASPDGSQEYELWSSGNAEVLQIKGLPN